MCNKIRETNLKPYNTFGFDVTCAGIIEIYSVTQLKNALKESIRPFRILGGGSNILLTENLNEHILKNNIKGIDIIQDNDEDILVSVGAGETWHNFVMWSLSHKLYGLENMALIPGSVGAAPMQNIGAYGVEQDTVFHSLQAFQINTGELHSFSKEDCHFGYRESVFKNELKGQYFITSVTYRLHKTKKELNTSYGAISDLLRERNITEPTSIDIAEIVMDIRKSKLPDPKEIGNAGSFFKNPVISLEKFKQILEKHPNIPHYSDTNNSIKIPAAWLIDQLGYKGLIKNKIGVHKNQALVLVHYGGGKGKDVWELAQEIQHKVKETYGLDIFPEVNIW